MNFARGAIATLVLLAAFSSLAAESKLDAAEPPWPQAPKAAAGAPNIVIILLDDVGFGAPSTFGGPVPTPALDQLAAQGLRYNRFHVAALCTPTRASLLSGRNHHRASFGTVPELASSQPGYASFWPKSVVSLPEMLRRNGYSTAAFGKWHNTPIIEINPTGPFDRWPTGLGFEYFYGFHLGQTSQWDPVLYRNTTMVDVDHRQGDHYQLTADLVDDALRWLHTHESVVPDKPWFLYFASGAIHNPHHAPPEWIAKFKGQFDQGWDKLREKIFARQKQLGVIPANADLTPRPKELPAWADLNEDQRRLYARQAEVASGYLAYDDAELGRLVEAIHKGPNGDNTLILYITGDNGASAEGGLEGGIHQAGERPHAIEPDRAELLKNIDKLGGPDFDTHYMSAWAWAMDTPFQWTKQIASHFGGTRNGMVASWPARIKDGGGLRDQFTHVNDVAPTIYELLGIKMPVIVDGVKQEPIDGSSFAKSLTDARAPSIHHVQYFEQLGNRAIYQDGWVAAAFHAVPWVYTGDDRDFNLDRWELYNIDEDFSEAHDLAEKYPAKLEALKKLFDAEAEKNRVLPMISGMSAGIKNLNSPLRPSLIGSHKAFRYFGDSQRIQTSAMPKLDGSHHIIFGLDIPQDGASGVILADGGYNGGFVFYVKDGRLVYESNFVGREHTVIMSTMPMPTGRVNVRYDYQRQSRERWGGGIGRLTINGQQAGEGKIEHVGRADQYDTFDLGADYGTAVSNAYVKPGKFNGTVNEVRITVD